MENECNEQINKQKNCLERLLGVQRATVARKEF